MRLEAPVWPTCLSIWVLALAGAQQAGRQGRACSLPQVCPAFVLWLIGLLALHHFSISAMLWKELGDQRWGRQPKPRSPPCIQLLNPSTPEDPSDLGSSTEPHVQAKAKRVSTGLLRAFPKEIFYGFGLWIFLFLHTRKICPWQSLTRWAGIGWQLAGKGLWRLLPLGPSMTFGWCWYRAHPCSIRSSLPVNFFVLQTPGSSPG